MNKNKIIQMIDKILLAIICVGLIISAFLIGSPLENNMECIITIINFMGLVYLIQTIDMFSSAQIMINYMCGNPFIGHNTYSFCEDIQEEDIQAKTGRFPPSNNGGSFFTNKLDDM